MSKKSIQERIRQGKRIVTYFPVMNRRVQEKVHFIVNELLEKYDRPDLKEVAYSALKEIIINGVKANLKHYLFKTQLAGENVSDEERKKVLAMLKNNLNERELERFYSVALHEKLRVRVRIDHDESQIRFRVTNNTQMTEEENNRIIEKFKQALEYNNLAEYYMNFADDMEGSGIGITMIVLMLKNVGLDPYLFTVSTERKITVAKVELPLQDALGA
jgi:Lhr-like helicase